MPEYVLPRPEPVRTYYGELDAFTQGYIEALFFMESSPAWDKAQILADPEGWAEAEREGVSDGSIPGDAAFGDLSAESLGKIIRDCRVFQQLNEALLEKAYGRGYEPEQAGRDYWFTRNGHGVGYWCRDELDAEGLGDALSEACRHDEVYVHWTDWKVYAE